jgi:hypothetical protein
VPSILLLQRIKSKESILIILSLVLGFLLVSSGAFSSAYSPNFTVGKVVQVSPNASPFKKSCEGGSAGGTMYFNSKVEPMVSTNPTNSKNTIGVYQQDRWSNGGNDGDVAAYTTNAGANWTVSWPTFTHCEGGNKHNNGDFERSSDPWISFSPNGVAYYSSLVFNYSYNSESGVDVAKSTNGGKTWSTPTLLYLSGGLSDKDSVTADPTNSSYAYVVWDDAGTGNQIYFSRTTNGGNTWSTGREIYGGPTINNIIVVLPNGELLDTFTNLDNGYLSFITSTNHGKTWSSTVHNVAYMQANGVTDPGDGLPVRSGAGLASVTVDDKTGYLYAAWEDARFSGVEAIAFSMSKDGGKTWSTPIQVNKSPKGVQAFTPAVQVDGNGVVAVSYYDFRNYHSGDKTTPTDQWIVECSSACTKKASWTEQHVYGSFNMRDAVNAGGEFLGDYSGIANTGSGFQPFFIATISNLKIRSNAYSAPVTG